MKAVFVDDEKCLSCHSCEIACVIAHSQTKSLFGVIGEDIFPKNRIHVEAILGGSFPLPCRHCDDPHCVRACVTKALYVDKLTGAVLHDTQRCIGCTMCVLACPFGLIEEQDTADNSCAISKCDLCLGEKSDPACVDACPTGALRFEETSAYSKDKRRAYLVEFASEK
jgi:carbon-monoxide dehydrogenase iron sulfur subunit